MGKTYYPNMPRQKSSVALRKEKEAAKNKKPSGYRPNLADVYGADRRNTKPLKMKESSYEKAIKANQKELDKLEKGKEPATAKRYREMKKEEVQFSDAELESIQAKVDSMGLDEERSDTLKDRRAQFGGHAATTDYTRAPKPGNTDGKKKGGGDALAKVKADMKKKYGEKSIINYEETELDEDNMIVPGPRSAEHELRKKTKGVSAELKRENEKRVKSAFGLSDKEKEATKKRREGMERKANLERSFKAKDGKPEGATSDYYARQRKNLERTLKKEELASESRRMDKEGIERKDDSLQRKIVKKLPADVQHGHKTKNLKKVHGDKRKEKIASNIKQVQLKSLANVRRTKKALGLGEDTGFSQAELESIQAKIDSWED